MALVFEWDDWKARENERKHGISFDEASSVFDDSLAKIFPDEDHSNGEEREIIVGHSVLDRLLVVSFAEPVRSRIRIISARRVTRREQTAYEEET
ncbi:MAG: BrnT family toxin [Terriglobales bacterium]